MLMEERVAAIYREAELEPADMIPGAASAACEMLRARLRPGVTEEDCAGTFRFAAAMLAIALLEELSGEKDIASFSAGEVKVNRYVRERFPKNAFWIMAPWLTDPGFEVRGAQG